MFLFKPEAEGCFLACSTSFQHLFPCCCVLSCCFSAVSWAPAAGGGLEGCGELSVLERNETSPCPLCQLGLLVFPREGSPFIWLTVTRTTEAGLVFHSLQAWMWDSLQKLLCVALPGVFLAEGQELVPRTLGGLCFVSNKVTDLPHVTAARSKAESPRAGQGCCAPSLSLHTHVHSWCCP